MRRSVVPSFNEGTSVQSTSPGLACLIIHDSTSGKHNSQEGTLHWEVSAFNETPSKVALVCGKGDVSILSHLRNVPELQSLKSEALSIRLFYNVSRSAGALKPLLLSPSLVDGHSGSAFSRHSASHRHRSSTHHAHPEQTNRKQERRRLGLRDTCYMYKYKDSGIAGVMGC